MLSEQIRQESGRSIAYLLTAHPNHTVVKDKQLIGWDDYSADGKWGCSFDLMTIYDILNYVSFIARLLERMWIRHTPELRSKRY